MRLTLRTLLAFIDRVLSPSDHDELQRRIQQNEVIGRLSQRIERLTGYPEMLTPRLNAPGLAGDPNAIAEYLDDVLPSSLVPELERTCLESDEHLAELAHCHQLLATAIRTPVAVPESLRRRAIELIDPVRREAIERELLTRKRNRKLVGRSQVIASPVEDVELTVEQPADAASPVPSPMMAPMMASGGGTIRPEGLDLEDAKLAREVPEYLVGSTSSGMWRMPLAIGLVALALGLMIWQALGPWERVRELLIARTPSEDIFANDPPLRVRQIEQPEPDDSVFHELVISEEEPPLPAAVNPPPSEEPQETDREPESEIAESNAAPPLPSAPADATANEDGGVEIDASEAAPPLPVGVTEVVDRAERGDSTPSEPAIANGQICWTPADDSEQSFAIVLLRTAEGLRVAQPNVPTVTEELVIPPYSRTQLTLPGQIEWVAGGPSRLRVEQISEETAVRTSLCRAFIRSPKQLPIRLLTPAGEFRIVPTAADMEVAIEVGYRPAKAGSLLDAGVMRPVFVVTVTAGTATIEDISQDDPAQGASKAETALSVGEAVGVVAGTRPNRFMMRAIPDWYRSSTSRSSDKFAMQDAIKLLTPAREKPAAASALIAEMVENRRAETAALAVQMEMLYGSWESFADPFLSDIRFRNYWTPGIELAQQLLAADAQSAETLRQTLVAKHGAEQGEKAYRLLAESLVGSQTLEPLVPLVGELESSNLTIRILAGHQLEQATGQTMAYQPHAPAKASVQQWRRELAGSRMQLPPSPDVLYERGGQPKP